MLNLNRILLVAGTLMGFVASAQENFQDGYIVHGQNDTVRGQIDYREWVANPESVRFRDAAGEKTDYQAADLTAFFVHEEIYRNYRVHVVPYIDGIPGLTEGNAVPEPYETTAFLRLVTGGKLNLYALRDRSDEDYFFIQGATGIPVQLEISTVETQRDGVQVLERRDEYQYQLARWVADCPGLAKPKIAVDYAESALRKLIARYNHCGQSLKDVVAKTDRGGRRVFFSPLVGFEHSSVKVSGQSYEAGENWRAYNTFTGGVGMLIVLPRSRGQFSFVADALYQHFFSAGSPTNGGYGLYLHGNFDFDQAQLDLLFRYRYPASPKIRPFIDGGIGQIAVFNNKSTRYINTVGPQPLFGDASYMHKFQMAIIGGIGVEISRFTLEARIEKPGAFTSIVETSANLTHLSVLAGFNF